MAITTYAELKTAVANWLERDDLTERVPEFIALAESRIAKTVRAREMEATENIATVIATSSYSLPSDYLQFRRIYYVGASGTTRLEYRTPIAYWSIYAALPQADPQVFTVEGEQILFGPTPIATDSVNVLYYKKLTAFSADADTNSLLTNATGLYLYGALIESAPFLGNDPRVLIWTQMWEDLVERVDTSDRRDRASGDVRPGWDPVRGSPLP